jgi:hypothetical protein
MSDPNDQADQNDQADTVPDDRTSETAAALRRAFEEDN